MAKIMVEEKNAIFNYLIINGLFFAVFVVIFLCFSFPLLAFYVFFCFEK